MTTAVMEPCPLGEGHDHPAGWCCGAKLRQGPGYDRRRAGWGTDHVGAGTCKLHLGSTRTHRKAGSNELEQRRIAGEVGKFLAENGLDPSTVNYVDVLAEQVVTAHGMAAVLKMLVGQLSFGELTGPDHLDDDRAEAHVELLRVWTVEAARLSKMALDIGIDERRVRILEAQGIRLVEMQERIFADVFAALVARGVAVELLDRVRRDELPAIVRAAVIDANARDAGDDTTGTDG